MSKRVLLAVPHGFCAGVDRAVQVVEQALARFGAPIYVRHEIVHNTYVIASLETAGAVFTDDLDDIPEGARVIFSAHGVSPAVREHADRRGLQVIDATCPLVSKVHAEAGRHARDGRTIALIGHPEHVEVVGTYGHAPDQTIVINPDDSAPGIDALPAGGDVVWLSQTTLAVDDVANTVTELRERFPDLLDPPSDDICYASTNRQAAVKLLAPHCDLVLVVGSPTSSNSRRLVEVAAGAGAAAAHLLDSAAELRPEWLEQVATLGVTAGASVPDYLVDQLMDKLVDYGFDSVEQVVITEEDITFGLPAALRSAPRAREQRTQGS
jgi:4-hydroxy-3-methylbut-2-enyl diphosphate reductase